MSPPHRRAPSKFANQSKAEAQPQLGPKSGRTPGLALPHSSGVELSPSGLHEIKHDGYRIIACKAATGSACGAATGGLAVAVALRTLRTEEMILEGEAMALCKDGRPNFHGLHSENGGAAACYSPSSCVTQ
jgi:ATP-dependent DNA ligase